MPAGSKQKSKSRSKAGIVVERSSGNVFEDLGLPNSPELLVKSEIVARIASIIEKRGLTQVTASKLFGVSQAEVSDLVRGKLKGFSTDRLFRFLTALGQDIEITMPRRLHTRRAGNLRIIGEPRVAAAGGSRSKR